MKKHNWKFLGNGTGMFNLRLYYKCERCGFIRFIFSHAQVNDLDSFPRGSNKRDCDTLLVSKIMEK